MSIGGIIMSIVSKIRSLIAASAVASLGVGCVEKNYYDIITQDSLSNTTTTAQPTNPTGTATPSNPTPSSQPTSIINPLPLYTNLLKTNSDGSIAVGIDLRNATIEHFVSIDTVSNTSIILDNKSTHSKVKMIEGTTALFEERVPLQLPTAYGATYQQDLTLRDLVSGVTLFATNSPDKNELFVGMNNGKFLYQDKSLNYIFTNAWQVDTNGHHELVIPHASAAEMFRNEWGFFVTEHTALTDKIYTLDNNGTPQLLIDAIRANPPVGWFSDQSRPDFIAYMSLQDEIVFQPIGITNTSSIVIPRPQSQTPKYRTIYGIAPRSFHAIAADQDSTSTDLYDVDLLSPTPVVSIVLPQGVEPLNVIVSDQSALIQDSQSTNDIYLYSRQNGLQSILMPHAPTVTSTLDSEIYHSKGKAIIIAEWNNKTNWQDEYTVHFFDGQQVIQVGSRYDDYDELIINEWTSAVVATRLDTTTGQSIDDLITIDMQTNAITIHSATPTAQIDSFAVNQQGDIAFAEGTRYSWTNPSNKFSNLYFRRKGNQPVQLDASVGPISQIMFSPDGQAIFYTAQTGPRDVIKYDVTKGTWTVIAHQ